MRVLPPCPTCCARQTVLVLGSDADRFHCRACAHQWTVNSRRVSSETRPRLVSAAEWIGHTLGRLVGASVAARPLRRG
jgi:hypothetical protein